jgi:hypothetical protein
VRERLPNRRNAFVYEYNHDDQVYVAHVGRYGDHENGRIGEIFVSGEKVGTGIDTGAREASTILSIALQCGAEFDSIRRALPRDPQGKATGPIGAVMDLIAEEAA